MTTIITRKSVTPGAQPVSLEVGELAVNVADATLWTSDGTTVKSVGGSGGGSGDLPTGSAEGQMLRWTSTGEATWSVTDVITVTENDNVAIGGAEYSAAYKLTVNGNAYISGSLAFDGGLCSSLTGDNLVMTQDPQTANSVTRQSYTEGRYVGFAGSQTISGYKTFSAGISISGTCYINGLATSTSQFMMVNDSGYMRKGGVPAMAKDIGPLLEQFATIMGATPAQMTQVGALVTPFVASGLLVAP